MSESGIRELGPEGVAARWDDVMVWLKGQENGNW